MKTRTTSNHLSIIAVTPATFALKSSITHSRSWQFFFISFCASSSNSIDQCHAQNVPLKITCKYKLGKVRLNTTSFLVSQMAQHTPTNIGFLSLREKPASQEPNIFVTLTGGWIPKVKNIADQTNLATWQSKKRCWIVSAELQKQHLLSLFQFLFNRLSLVRVTYFEIPQEDFNLQWQSQLPNRIDYR